MQKKTYSTLQKKTIIRNLIDTWTGTIINPVTNDHPMAEMLH